MWVYVFVLILSIAISIAMRPKPQSTKPPSLADFSVPTAEEGREEARGGHEGGQPVRPAAP